MEELEQIVLHLINREYSEVIDRNLSTEDKVLLLAREFRNRLSSLVANWIRVGFCQGNFNSDNCAAGGFTLDYGPFGFMDVFDPSYQSWTGGGKHYSFLNQPMAAERNFHTFCMALQPLLQSHENHMQQLDEIARSFSKVMRAQMKKMWASKLGLKTFDAALFNELQTLMVQTSVDYTIFFRELSQLPKEMEALKKSFYKDTMNDEVLNRWSMWFDKWKSLIHGNITSQEDREVLSREMKLVNPKYTLREWFLVPAYQQATTRDYTLIKELQEIMIKPYDEQSKDVQEKFYRLKPSELFEIAGISHVSCSS